MTISWVIAGVVIFVGLALSAFFSGVETGFYCLNRVRLQVRVQKGDRRAKHLAHMLDDQAAALCVTLTGTNAMNYLTTGAVAYVFADLLHCSEHATELYTVACLTPILFVFGEVVPKNLFQVHADTLMLRFHGLLSVANRVFRMVGVVWFLKSLVWAGNRMTGVDEPLSAATFEPKHRMAMLLREGLAGKAFADDQVDLIDRVCRLSETRVGAVMVPWNRVHHIPPPTNYPGLRRAARRSDHRRLPVSDPHRHRVLGVIDVDELLGDADWTEVTECLEPVPTIDPNETVASAIVSLRAASCELAIVSGRGGRPIGLVTVQGLVNTVLHGL